LIAVDSAKANYQPYRNMRRNILLHLALVSASVAPSASFGSTPAVTISSSVAGLGGFSGPILTGWEFTVTTPVVVDSLGLYTASPYAPFIVSPTSGAVGLWQTASGSLLTSCYVNDTDPIANGFKYHDITSSGVTLSPGVDYTVALLITDGSGYVGGQTGYQCGADINFVAPRFDWAYWGLQMPVTEALGGFGPSFTYAEVPEPGVGALLILGAGILGLRAKRIATTVRSSF
jgi:hypothetical protein